MTRDDIIRMARQHADEVTNGYGVVHYEFDLYSLEKFALLLTATEREACAKVCDELVTHAQAKGDNDAMLAAISCAFAIRARGAP